MNRCTMGVNSLLKTVTRRRRDCDLNPGLSAPESSTLTTTEPLTVYTSLKTVAYVHVEMPPGRRRLLRPSRQRALLRSSRAHRRPVLQLVPLTQSILVVLTLTDDQAPVALRPLSEATLVAMWRGTETPGRRLTGPPRQVRVLPPARWTSSPPRETRCSSGSSRRCMETAESHGRRQTTPSCLAGCPKRLCGVDLGAWRV